MRQWLIVFAAALVLSSCGGKKYTEKPVDALIKKNMDAGSFSIILTDMDVEEGTFSDKYKHKYKVVRMDKGDSTLKEAETDWYYIQEKYFWEHEGNLGMALATMDEDGKLVKKPSPPGYNNYVGNTRYGYWHSGGYWAWYGRYAFMRSAFGYGAYPIYHTGYMNYRTNYYGQRAYYGGSSSSPRYGTNSASTRKSNPSFFSRRQSKTGWSSSSKSSASKSSGVGTSRYNSSSSSRSSGGGYGK